MRISRSRGERLEKLYDGFSLLDERGQEYIFGVLQALDFASKKAEGIEVTDVPVLPGEAEKGFVRANFG